MTDLPTELMRHPDRLDRRTSRVVLVDVQERLLAAMPDAASVIGACRLLGDAAGLFAVPVIVTEQYPKGLGSTTAELSAVSHDVRAKQRFSAAEALAFAAASEAGAERDQIVIAGIEAHVCVAQTAFDLLSLGYRVTVAADAVTSRRPLDRDLALLRMRDHGVTVSTVEAIVFEWCETADDPQFKALSQFMKQRAI